MEKQITSYKLDKRLYDQLPLTFAEFENRIGHDKWNRVFTKMTAKLDLIHKAFTILLNRNPQFKNSTCFQLFGVDVILNSDLEPFVLEYNKGPEMNYVNDRDYQMKYRMQKDLFDKIKLLPHHQPNLFG
jgi:hypothetical protein